MTIFLTLLAKIIPLYIIIALGFLAGQKLNVTRDSVANLVIYLVVPFVFFGATAQMEVQREFLPLPLAVFAIAITIGLGAYKLAGKIWKDGRKNIVGYTMGTSNQGYFGIPVFLALFGPEHLGLYVYAGLGLSLYENTFGYYLMARGRYTVKESLLRLFRLPLMPAALCGFLFSLCGFKLPQPAIDFYMTFKGAYTVLGMMIIGLGLSSLHHLKNDIKFTGFIFAGKFIVWPIVMFGFIWLYEHLTGPLLPITKQILILLSVLPLAANAVAFASSLKVEPDKAATTVILSTLFALFYIPFVVAFLIGQ